MVQDEANLSALAISRLKKLKLQEEEAQAKIDEEKAAAEEIVRYSKDPRKGDGSVDLWESENERFWHTWRLKMAYPSLFVLTYDLFLMFAIWKQWGGIIGGMNKAYKKDPTMFHFGYEDASERSGGVSVLGGIAGLCGAVHRSIHAFLPGYCGGRIAAAMNSVVGLISCFLMMLALSSPDCSYWFMFVTAVMTGCGGGGFSSTMAHVSEIFPRRLQGTSLGVCGGFGNLGISAAQFLTFTFGYNRFCLAGADGKCETESMGGTYLYQVELIWVILLAISIPLSWWYVFDLPHQGYQPPPLTLRPYRNFWNTMRFLQVQAIIYFAAFVGAAIFIGFAPIVKKTPIVACIRGFSLAAATAGCTVGLLFLTTQLGSDAAKQQLSGMYKIFRTFENVLLSMLYIMTFSSFIGYANAFPKLVKAMYPHVVATDYTWMPAFLGSFARAGGGFFADAITGAYSTGLVALTMTVMTFGLGFTIRATMATDDPSEQFPFFILLNAILFIATGCGNATVFRLIGALMSDDKRDMRAAMLGWTGAMAAYGGAIFPTFFDAGIALGVNDLMYYVISGYYAVCGFITWRYCFWVTPVP